MKLVRYGAPGAEKPGLIDGEGTLRDLSGHVDDINGAMLGDASLDALRALDPASLPAVDGDPRLGACVTDFGKFLCIGLNYSDHAAETGAAIRRWYQPNRPKKSASVSHAAAITASWPISTPMLKPMSFGTK